MQILLFSSATVDDLTQVFPSQTNRNLLIRKNMFDVVTNSDITTKQHENPSTQLDTTPPFRFLLRAHHIAR